MVKGKLDSSITLEDEDFELKQDLLFKKFQLVLSENKKDDHRNNGCGLGSFFRPKWLQKFATPRSFMTVFGLLGTVQAMAFVYFIATLTTMERRFGIPSRTTGLMLSGNEMSQIMLSLFLSYAGGQRNRPLWLAWGVAFSAFSCFILLIPHIMYGPGDKAISLTKEYADHHAINQTSLDIKEKMGMCSKERPEVECEEGDYSAVPPLLVFFSQFILGIGTTLSHSLGQPYIDDNTKKTNTPMLLGLTLALRTIGPALGFVIGYLCLSIYVDPSKTPLIDKNDSRWIGAWWMGWLFLGTIMLLFSFLIAMFPKALPKTKPGAKQIQDNGKSLELEHPEPTPPSMKEFPAALKRLLKNKLLVVNIFSGIFYILGSSGYITYLNKYIEVQFEKSAADSNLVMGPLVLSAMVLGFLVSGFVISKYKPTPKYLLGWNVVVGIAFVLGELALTFVSCDRTNLVGYNPYNRSIDIINSCNVECGCENLKFSPVCLVESSLTFYSACHAGCHTSHKEGKNQTYGDCTCIPQDSVSVANLQAPDSYQYSTYQGIMKEGHCPSPCGSAFLTLLILSSFMHLLGSSGKIGNILVNYRAVDPIDKSFAQGFALLLVSLLAFIPGPIVFGALIDAACIIWDSSCGKRGNCWFYDKHAFRKNLNLTAAAITSIGVILDGVVCYLGRDLKLYEEEEPQPVTQKSEKNGSAR
uniref:Solute carrier organic anion transporter family member n=1 Tax=Lygus hesperus TaxID=30085 RepID=A0A146LLL7_LYGHE